MSTRIMGICWPLTDMSIVQKAVLISLADQANDHGVCWPSVGTIAERICGSDRTVQDAIRWLISAKILSRHYQAGKPTIYTVTPANYAPPQEAHPAGNNTEGVRDIPVGGAPSANITVIEPSVEPSVPTRKKSAIEINTYIEQCKANKVAPIESDNGVFKYAKKIKLPDEFLWICWREFVDRNRVSRKRYPNWSLAFQNCVRNNWYRLWYLDAGTGQYALTTTGLQAERMHADARKTA